MGVTWKITKNKTLNQRMDLEVAVKVRELEFNGAEDVKSLRIDFKKKLDEIRQTNTYSADCLYEMTQINPSSCEIWKKTPNGDFKYLMFTLTKSTEKFNPFNF